MKRVLIVDASPIFREFLKDKLSEEKIEVYFSQESRDAMTKMISLLPDLVILNLGDVYNEPAVTEFLTKKKADPNASRIPVIACGSAIDKTQIAKLSQFAVVKYFQKPIKFDVFFESIGRILHVAFSMDITPCVLDLHINNGIIFIEVAKGLNREKLFLLKYKLAELIENSSISEPKIIVMLSNLELSFVDGLNLELLLDNILSYKRIVTRNVKILSFSYFVKELINGHPRYNGIEVTTDISRVLNSLVETSVTSSVSDLITDKILNVTSNQKEGSIQMRFVSDTGIQKTESVKDSSETKIAIVDDNSVILKLLKTNFENEGIKCEIFNSGSEFLPKVNQTHYKLIIMDILMPGISGFDTLRKLQALPEVPPVIIYSKALQQEMAVQALSLGAKICLPKPQKPEVIIQKVKEILGI